MLQYIHYEESDDMINYDYNHIDIACIKIVKKYLEYHELEGTPLIFVQVTLPYKEF